MAYERITEDPVFDGVRDSHELRYHIARGFIEDTDTVIDAGCGIGYGEKILKANYVGLDKINGFDLEKDNYDKPYDVFVGFEIIEHLENIDKFVQLAKQAKKWIIVSTPIVPTAEGHPYHKRDFTSDDLIGLFQDNNFKLYEWVRQGLKYGIFIFKRC